MSLFAAEPDVRERWMYDIDAQDVQKYKEDNREVLEPTQKCLRLILTTETPHQMAWMKYWMKHGGVLDELWTNKDGQVISIFEVIHELKTLSEEVLDLFERVRVVYNSLWMRMSKKTAESGLTTMQPELRCAFLMSKCAGPFNHVQRLVYHAIATGRTELARFLLLPEHGQDEEMYDLVIRKRSHMWIVWFVENGAEPAHAIEHFVLKNDIANLMKLIPRDMALWAKKINDAIRVAVIKCKYDALEWLLTDANATVEGVHVLEADALSLKILLDAGLDPNLYDMDKYREEHWPALLSFGVHPTRPAHIVEPWAMWLSAMYDGRDTLDIDMEKVVEVLENMRKIRNGCEKTKRVLGMMEMLCSDVNT